MKKLILIIVIAACLPANLLATGIKPTHINQLFIWLNENLNYPENAIKNREEGTVFIAFTVSETVKAENIEIRSGISPALDQEAIKAVKRMPLSELYSPESIDKEFILPIRFSIK